MKRFCSNNLHLLLYCKILSITLCLFFYSCTSQTEKTQKTSFEQQISYNRFQNPNNQYRSYPFFSLNDSLSPDEIKRQIRSFKNAGFGGFYLHSRDGLLTPFLGEDWWKAMEAGVEQGNASGLQTCFYDEDKWPSGYAGGIIPEMSEDYRAKCLVRLNKSTPLPVGSEILKTDADYNYIVYTVQLGNPTFNGTCWVDLFNPEMVQQFIRTAYKPYVDKYKNKIAGNTFTIWTDEAHIHARYFDKGTPHKGILSYSPFVRKKFKELFGYDLTDKLNLLFEEKDNWRQVRLQFHQAVALQFEESYTKQIGNYCAINGVSLTGHFLGEERLNKVRDRIGNAMLHYRNMQQPGIDHLGLSIKNSLIAAKSLTSVANQYNITGRMSEVFGISGQNMNFEDRKWIIGWHTILGINRFCPHLSLYSLKGLRKRDYPPTFSYHQPYWKFNKIFEDYSARLSYATSIGQYAPQWLVINPLESEYIIGQNENQLTNPMWALLENLQSAHIDYDLGDEQIISDTANISNAKFKIGKMNYPGVILPEMITIRKSTVKLLESFIVQGGKVVYTGNFPQYIDGIKDDVTLTKLKMKCSFVELSNISQLNNYIAAHLQIDGEDAGKIWSMVRKTDKGHLIQLYNTSHTTPYTFSISSNLLKNNPVLWDPDAVKCYKLKPDHTGHFVLNINPSSTVMITTDELSNEAITEGFYQIPKTGSKVFVLENKWKGNRLNPNAITLDFAEYTLDNGQTYCPNQPVIGIFQRLSDEKYTGNLTLRYSVKIKDVPQVCNLVVEQPEMYNNISMNGKKLTFIKDSFYIDRQFKLADVQSCLKNGINEISLSLNFKPANPSATDISKRYGTEIESIYLTGNFAVKAHYIKETLNTQRNLTGDFIIRPVYGLDSFYICKEDTFFHKNLTISGYPFYTGSFTLSQQFNFDLEDEQKKYILHIPNFESIVCEVDLNGKKQDVLTCSPFETDITDALKNGENTLVLTFTNSLRNLLGPSHQQRGELTRVGPHSFSGEGGFPDPRGDKKWYNLRLSDAPLKIWTDTYYCIPYGLLDDVFITEKN